MSDSAERSVREEDRTAREVERDARRARLNATPHLRLVPAHVGETVGVQVGDLRTKLQEALGRLQAMLAKDEAAQKRRVQRNVVPKLRAAGATAAVIDRPKRKLVVFVARAAVETTERILELEDAVSRILPGFGVSVRSGARRLVATDIVPGDLVFDDDSSGDT